MAVGTVFVVEDDTAREDAWEARRAELIGKGRALGAIVPLSAREAIERARGAGSASGRWGADDVLLLDCWDRDLPEDPTAGFGTVFFALDVLHELRDRRERGVPIPRVIAFSRAMQDSLVRAALAEYALPLRHERVPDGDPVKRVRVDASAVPFGPDAVLRGMFEVDVLMDRIVEVVAGDRSGGLAPPGPTDPVYADFLPTSCFASFHHELRASFPDLWQLAVLKGETVPLAHRYGDRKALSRLGRRFLEANPDRGVTYHGLIQLARRLAQPAPFVPARARRLPR